MSITQTRRLDALEQEFGLSGEGLTVFVTSPLHESPPTCARVQTADGWANFDRLPEEDYEAFKTRCIASVPDPAPSLRVFYMHGPEPGAQP